MVTKRKTTKKSKVKKDPKRSFSAGQKLSAFIIQDGKCTMCGRRLDKFTMIAHHNKEHHNGGKTCTENCRLVCSNCSSSHHRGKTPTTKKDKKIKKTVKYDILNGMVKKDPMKNKSIPKWL